MLTIVVYQHNEDLAVYTELQSCNVHSRHDSGNTINNASARQAFLIFNVHRYEMFECKMGGDESVDFFRFAGDNDFKVFDCINAERLRYACREDRNRRNRGSDHVRPGR